jgi:HAD superfamily hydrolase (TIGR01509 family)
MTIEAVLWDLDGTLVDSEPVHLESLEEVLHEEGLSVPPDLQEWLIGRTVQQAYETIVERIGLTLPCDTLVQRIYAAYGRRSRMLKARPHAMDIFRSLARQGVAQAIVSNSDRIIVNLNLHAVDLTHPDLVSISRNDIRKGKPDPEGYRRAAWLLGIEPASCAVVEDSPTGAVAGLAAGMHVFAWPDPATTKQAFPTGIRIAETGEELAEQLSVSIRTREPQSVINKTGGSPLPAGFWLREGNIERP